MSSDCSTSYFFCSLLPFLVETKCFGLLNNIWAFIDGTLRKTRRPFYFQKWCYSGHKRHHGLKFQSVYTPDGLFAHFYGPICGNCNESYITRGSDFLQQVIALFLLKRNTIYAVYGDPAYPQSPWLLGGFRNSVAGSDKAIWNCIMSLPWRW